MVLNFSTTEYAILCKVADFYDTKPGEWCHDRIMHEAFRVFEALKDWDREGGRQVGGRPDPTHQPPPLTHPDQEGA